jgi:hypothetical protein
MEVPVCYLKVVAKILAEAGIEDVRPHHVEAWMRVDERTLDSLSLDEFRALALDGAALAREAGPEMSERLAKSFGLQAVLV